MPELPEVETLRRGLEQGILNQRITEVVVANTKALKEQDESVFRGRVLGKRIERVDRRGKYLLIALAAADVSPPFVAAESGSKSSPVAAAPPFLCIHLKMRGQLRLESGGQAVGPYHCLSLILEGGRDDPEAAAAAAEPTALRYYDMWTWGEVRALTEEEIPTLAPGLATMGDEPLDPAWSGAALAAKLATRKTAIKPTLLDQRVVAGVGNIYADESLFRAGIHPERSAASLLPDEAERLSRMIRQVLREAVAGGGTTSDDYSDVAGVAGRFTPQVYDRGGAPCVTCGQILTRIRLAGRGTVFCPNCQVL